MIKIKTAITKAKFGYRSGCRIDKLKDQNLVNVFIWIYDMIYIHMIWYINDNYDNGNNNDVDDNRKLFY